MQRNALNQPMAAALVTAVRDLQHDVDGRDALAILVLREWESAMRLNYVEISSLQKPVSGVRRGVAKARGRGASLI